MEPVKSSPLPSVSRGYAVTNLSAMINAARRDSCEWRPTSKLCKVQCLYLGNFGAIQQARDAARLLTLAGFSSTGSIGAGDDTHAHSITLRTNFRHGSDSSIAGYGVHIQQGHFPRWVSKKCAMISSASRDSGRSTLFQKAWGRPSKTTSCASAPALRKA